MTEPPAPPALLPGLARRLRPPLPRRRRRQRGRPQGAHAARLRGRRHRDRPIAQRRDGGAGPVAPRRGAPDLRRGDASAFRLVVTATGIPEVDGAVYADAEAAGVWANSADDRRPLLLHPPRGPPRRCGHRVGLDGRAESRARLMAPDPPGDGVRRRPRHPGAAARRGPGASQASGCAQRLGGLGAPTRRPSARARTGRRPRRSAGQLSRRPPGCNTPRQHAET